jgi:hypothetical protein
MQENYHINLQNIWQQFYVLQPDHYSHFAFDFDILKKFCFVTYYKVYLSIKRCSLFWDFLDDYFYCYSPNFKDIKKKLKQRFLILHYLAVTYVGICGSNSFSIIHWTLFFLSNFPFRRKYHSQK